MINIYLCCYESLSGYFTKILGSKSRRPQKWPEKTPYMFFSIKLPNRAQISWNSFWMSKTIRATRFKLNFDELLFFRRHSTKPVFWHFWYQSQLSPIYQGPLMCQCVLFYLTVIALLYSEDKPEGNSFHRCFFWFFE